MTIRAKRYAKTAGAAQTIIAGSFIPNGSSAISTTRGTGLFGFGFTVARTGTGKYKVTLDRSFANFVSIVVGGQFASADGNAHQFLVGDQSVTNKTFEIMHLTSADVSTTNLAAADISTSGTANKVHFICVVADSDVPGAGV